MAHKAVEAKHALTLHNREEQRLFWLSLQRFFFLSLSDLSNKSAATLNKTQLPLTMLFRLYRVHLKETWRQSFFSRQNTEQQSLRKFRKHKIVRLLLETGHGNQYFPTFVCSFISSVSSISLARASNSSCTLLFRVWRSLSHKDQERCERSCVPWWMRLAENRDTRWETKKYNMASHYWWQSKPFWQTFYLSTDGIEKLQYQNYEVVFDYARW